MSLVSEVPTIRSSGATQALRCSDGIGMLVALTLLARHRRRAYQPALAVAKLDHLARGDLVAEEDAGCVDGHVAVEAFERFWEVFRHDEV